MKKFALTIALLFCIQNQFYCGSDAEAFQYGISERPANKTCLAFEKALFSSDVASLVRVFEDLVIVDVNPLGMYQSPGNSDFWYMILRHGELIRFSTDEETTSYTVVMDITDMVDADGEGGLLSMAFHPNFVSNGYFYLSYTSAGLVSHVDRFTSNDDGATASPSSKKSILSLNQPYTNHNGGAIAFGPDGYLYIAFGDGGNDEDMDGNAQNTGNLFGSILRINVDSGNPYSIPADNPFASSAGRDEIFAYGFRNPWRMSFDMVEGDLWVGDVGEGEWEEVDLVVNGGNYGWNHKEGPDCFNPSSGCQQAGLIDPVDAYDHSEGVSVVAGFVYRGSQIPELYGSYIFSDWISGLIWAIPEGETDRQLLMESGTLVGGFAEANDGEIFVLGFDGPIYKLIPNTGESPPSDVPTKISQSGCFKKSNPDQPVDALIEYDLNSVLWSDSAAKKRFMAIPDGTTIEIDENGDFIFPEGTVLAKQFYLQDKIVETRLLVKHDNGSWAGYSYAWDEAGTDATWLEGEEQSITFSDIDSTWNYPSGSQCMICHTDASNRSLGLELIQLNKELKYRSGITANQLETLDHIGFIDLDDNIAAIKKLSAIGGSDSQLKRVRSYLHTNCSNCHQPGGTGGGNMDFRYYTDFADQNVCNAGPENNLGISGSLIISEQNVDASIIYQRINDLEGNRMPPLGTIQRDDEMLALLSSWIQGLNCP